MLQHGNSDTRRARACEMHIAGLLSAQDQRFDSGYESLRPRSEPPMSSYGAGDWHACHHKHYRRSDGVVTSLDESNASVGGRMRSLAPG
jgi:hypothetical protein